MFKLVLFNKELNIESDISVLLNEEEVDKFKESFDMLIMDLNYVFGESIDSDNYDLFVEKVLQ